VKKYHSLAAKGEQVDISELAKNEKTDANTEPVTKNQKSPPSNRVASQSVEQPPQTTTGAQSAKQPTPAKPSIPTAQAAPVATPNPPSMGGAMPQALLNTGNPDHCRRLEDHPANNGKPVQDEGLKNLMMSWYYAGYYTGLLEGQQKAFASMQEGG